MLVHINSAKCIGIDAVRVTVEVNIVLGIGKLPSVALEVCLGHDLVLVEENSLRLTVIVIVVAVVYGAVWWYGKRKKRK